MPHPPHADAAIAIRVHRVAHALAHRHLHDRVPALPLLPRRGRSPAPAVCGCGLQRLVAGETRRVWRVCVGALRPAVGAQRGEVRGADEGREVCAADTTTAAVVANAAAVAVEEQHAAAIGQGEDAVDVLAEERDGVGAVGAEGTDRGVRRAVAG